MEDKKGVTTVGTLLLSLQINNIFSSIEEV
jgi:hypothetical protein